MFLELESDLALSTDDTTSSSKLQKRLKTTGYISLSTASAMEVPALLLSSSVQHAVSASSGRPNLVEKGIIPGKEATTMTESISAYELGVLIITLSEVQKLLHFNLDLYRYFSPIIYFHVSNFVTIQDHSQTSLGVLNYIHRNYNHIL